MVDEHFCAELDAVGDTICAMINPFESRLGA
jgi:hypothetical protein